jgi:hypothetical protein
MSTLSFTCSDETSSTRNAPDKEIEQVITFAVKDILAEICLVADLFLAFSVQKRKLRADFILEPVCRKQCLELQR